MKNYDDWSLKTLLCLNNVHGDKIRRDMGKKVATYLKKTGLIHHI